MTEKHLYIKERASSFACNEAPPLTGSNNNGSSNNGRSSNSRGSSSSSSKATKTRHRRSTSEDDPLGMACRELAQDLRRRSSLAPSSPSSAAPSCTSPDRHKEKSPSKKSSTSRSSSSSSSSATRSSRARKLAKAGTVARFSHSPKTSTSSRSSSEDVSSSSSSTKTTTTSSTLSLSTSAVALNGSSSRSSIMARKGRSTSAGGISSQLCLSSDGNTASSTSSHDSNSNEGPSEDRLPNVCGESENRLNKVAVSAGNENNLHSPKPSRKTHNEAASTSALTSPNRSSSGRSSPVMDEPSTSSSSSGKALEPVMKQLVAKMASRVHSLPHSLSKLPLPLEPQQQQQQGQDEDSSASKKRTSANPNPLSASSSSASCASRSKKSPLLGRHSSLTASSGSLPSVPSPSRGKHEYSKKEEPSAPSASSSSSSSSKRATKRTGSSGSISNFYRSLSNSELPTTFISSASSSSEVSVLSSSSSSLNYDASLSGSCKSPARRGILTRGIRHARDKRAKALEMKKDKRKSTRMKKSKGKKGVASSSSSSSSSLSNVEEAGRGGSSGGRTSSEREREGEREGGEGQGVGRPRKSSSSLLPSFGSASSSSMVVTRTNSLPFSAKDEMMSLPRRKTTEEATEVRDEEEEDEEEAEDEEEEAEDEEEDEEEDPDADEEGENPLSPADSEEASLEERIEEGMTRFHITMAKLDNERVDVKGKLECMNELVELCKSLGAEVIPGHPTGFHAYSFVKSMRVFVAHPVSKTMRQAALRVLRYFLAGNSMALYQQLIAQNLAYIIARILERDKEVTGERVEALKLIRRMMEVDTHCRLLPNCLLKAIIALIHQNNRPNHNNTNRTKAMDSFSCSCLETLCQLVVRNPKLVAECNGMKTLFWAAVEPFYVPLQDSVLVSLLYVMDEPARRIYIRPESDLRALFAPLMDVFTLSSTGGGAVGSEQMERWACCLRAISGILKSWAGLVFLYSDPLCLKSLMDGLRLPCEELHDIILDNMFKIFRLPTPKSNSPLTSMMMVKGKVMSKWGAEMGLVSDLPSRTYGKRANILDGYLAALLIIFVDIGLIECLIDLGKRQVSGTSYQSHVNSNYIPNIGVTSSPSNHPSPINHKHNLLDVTSASASASSTSFLTNTPKATVLLGELLHLANTLLPSSQCARLQQLPTLLHHAVTFQLHPRFWASANTTVNQLHHITNTKTIHSTHFYDREQCVAITGANRLKRLKGWDRRLDRIDHVKRKMDWEMDGKTLLSKLNTTQVLFTKDHEKWEWDVIAEVLEGPLRNPAHLDYCLANTKTKSFLERIIHFFKPSANLFSTLPWKPSNENTRLVRVACQMLENLVHSENGNAFLNGGDLLKELSDLLKALAEGNTDVVASIGSVQETMAREYFTMIGTLSSSTEGLEIMKKYKMFSYLRQIAQMEGGNLGLQRLALTCLDYNTSHGPARPLLKTCLSSPSKAIRCIATMHLRVLLRAGVQMFSAWGIDYLVKQLADSDPQVASIALSVLDEACDVRECLESLIAKRPSLFHMGRAGKDLLLRFLSVRSGFTYLSEIDFVKGELLSWKESESLIYVEELEHRLEQTLSVLLDDDKEVIDKVTIPPHLYGELAKTEAGCEVLANSGHLEECLLALTSPAFSPLRASSPPPSSSSSASSDFTGIQRRAAAWALGHVGASVTGLRLLEPHQAVKTLASLAQRDSSLSFRGTCFYALGLISRTEQGRSLLAELGWESPPDLNVSLPKDMQSNNALFMLAKYQFAAGWADLSQEATAATTEASPSSSSLSGASMALTPMTVYQVDDMRSQIITSVSNLCSKVTKKTHKMNLIRLRQRHPEAFQSRELVFDLFRMLECYCLTASTRRFIYNFQNPYLLDHQFFDLVSQKKRLRHNTNRGGTTSAVPTLLVPTTSSSSPSASSRNSSKEKGKEKEGERVSIRREEEEEDTSPQSALKKYLEISSI